MRLPYFPFRPALTGSRRRRAASLLLGLYLVLRLCAFERWLPQEVSTVVVSEEGDLLGAFPARDGQWRFPGRDTLPERFRICLMEAEDRRFFRHPGLDPLSTARAVRDNFRQKRVVSGGSTLTQQVARLCLDERFGPAKRRLWRKALEAWVAVSLEAGVGKRGILSLYATHAPFGGNVRGLDAAAWRWFGKSPETLSWGQTATLAVLPNAPSRIHPGRSRDALRRKRDRLLQRLAARGLLSPADLELARAEPLPTVPHALPQLAPHLAAFLRTRQEARWQTSLQRPLQEGALRLAREHLAELTGQEVHGLSALIVEVPENGAPRVRAWIGNASQDDAAAWQVDATLAPRSPGSTLKPFLYGLLMDRSRILPHEWLLDIPTRLGDLKPENADGICHGAVPADEALWRSLNIPWVRSLRDLGADPFLQWLRQAGLAHLFRSSDDYGMSLAVGGCETTLSELAAMYAALAQGGVAQPLVIGVADRDTLRLGGPSAAWTPPPTLPKAHETFLRGNAPLARRILSKGASWHVLEAMRHTGRSDEEAWWRAFAGGRPLAWKTGTSFGNRDAWAIGVAPGWVVAVWAGNPSGEGRTGLWGTQSSVPLLFRLFSLLPHDRPWFPPPDDMVPVKVCKETGARATALCSTATVMAPPAGAAAPPDRFHRTLHLDSAGFQVNAGCEPPARQVVRNVLVLPPVVEGLWRQDHPESPSIPMWRPDCKDGLGTNDLEILYPEPGAVVRLPKGMRGAQKLVLEARHRNPSAQVRCFLDQTDLGLSDRFLTWVTSPDPGQHVFTCVDEAGHQARASFTVDLPKL